ncbi:MAG TPA: hypothetical protein VGF17_20285, partial [Phytomonospora sp.]
MDLRDDGAESVHGLSSLPDVAASPWAFIWSAATDRFPRGLAAREVAQFLHEASREVPELAGDANPLRRQVEAILRVACGEIRLWPYVPSWKRPYG